MSDAYDPSRYGEIWADSYDQEHELLDPTSAVAVLGRLAAGRRVLELGIGTGRVALPLAEQGVDVVGVDASPAMLRLLRKKPGSDRLEIIEGDMASSSLGGPYGVVYLLFNTFFALPTQELQVACFRNVASALESGGHFVVECFVPDPARFRDGNQAIRLVRLDDHSTRLNLSLHDRATQTIRSQQLIMRDGQLSTMPVTARYAWPTEMDLMAELSGLRLAERWADWQRTAFTSSALQHVSVYEPR